MSDIHIFTNEEDQVVCVILARIENLFPEAHVNRLHMYMDLATAHHTCPLMLKELAEAEDQDFAHDIAGIHRHLNRQTGQLEDCFVPRYAAHQHS